MDLAPTATAAGVHLIACEVAGSTNADALALAREGRREPTWVTARRQIAGRGRRGRSWESPAGNLYASLLLVDPCAAAQAPQSSFVAALALHDATVETVPALRARISLKWPNDMLLDGRKLAGILVEGEGLSDGVFAAAIGIGVNCANHPLDAAYPATDLGEAGVTVTPEVLFRALSHCMLARLTQWRRGEAFAAIRQDWLDRTARIGEAIRVRTPAPIEGRFAGLDEHGRLLLRTASGSLQTIAAGDVRPSPAQAGEGLA